MGLTNSSIRVVCKVHGSLLSKPLLLHNQDSITVLRIFCSSPIIIVFVSSFTSLSVIFHIHACLINYDSSPFSTYIIMWQAARKQVGDLDHGFNIAHIRAIVISSFTILWKWHTIGTYSNVLIKLSQRVQNIILNKYTSNNITIPNFFLWELFQIATKALYINQTYNTCKKRPYALCNRAIYTCNCCLFCCIIFQINYYAPCSIVINIWKVIVPIHVPSSDYVFFSIPILLLILNPALNPITKKVGMLLNLLINF